MAATPVWSSPYPLHCPSWTRSLRVTHELRGRQPQWLCSECVPFLLLFDCQEAFHCCLVVTCINSINMISIQCHRVGEWWSGKPEFENVSDPAGVYIPFNLLLVYSTDNLLRQCWFAAGSTSCRGGDDEMSVLLAEKPGVPRGNKWPTASNWHDVTLSSYGK